MIYAALAAVIVAGLAWDFGRRWLAASAVNEVHRQRLDEVVADLARLTDEHGERLDELRGKYGDQGTAHNLRVRALQDKLDELHEHAERTDAQMKRLLGNDVESVDDINALRERLDALEMATADPPDIEKYRNALKLLGIEMREELHKRVTKDELESEINRINTVLAGGVAKGARRFA